MPLSSSFFPSVSRGCVKMKPSASRCVSFFFFFWGHSHLPATRGTAANEDRDDNSSNNQSLISSIVRPSWCPFLAGPTAFLSGQEASRQTRSKDIYQWLITISQSSQRVRSLPRNSAVNKPVLSATRPTCLPSLQQINKGNKGPINQPTPQLAESFKLLKLKSCLGGTKETRGQCRAVSIGWPYTRSTSIIYLLEDIVASFNNEITGLAVYVQFFIGRVHFLAAKVDH